MALTDRNILVVPNIGSASDPKIVFSGADASTAAQNITLTAYPTNGGTLSFDGSAGQLFSVTNSMSGTIFSANDVSGIPSIEVLDTGLVKLAQYSGNVLLGTGTDTGLAKLQVTGSLSLTGNALHSPTSRSIYGPNPTWSSYLYVGGDGVNGISRTNSIASIVTTDGNMHIDSGSSKTMYLNFYSGTGGVYFGNGASNYNATISAAGAFNGSNVTVNGNQTLHAGNYTSYSPTLTGGSASGTWGINVTGTAGSISGFNNPTTSATANTIVYRDGSGDIYSRYSLGGYVNTTDDTGTTGMTYIMAKFGDNYHRSANAAKVAAFISGQTMNIVGNAATATKLASGQSNWSGTGVIDSVVGMLTWKNYANGHVIFDASASTTPSGTACNNTTPTNGWTGTYPTLMGWNGIATFGVRVDSARVSDNGGVTSVNGSTGAVTVSAGATITNDNTTNATRYVVWEDVTSGSLSTVGLSSTKLTFNPSTGTLSATTFTSLSDVNKKTNVQPIANVQNVINSIDGVSFDWKDGSGSSYGFIAQELEKILPHAVSTDDSGTKSVNYSAVIPFLLETLKQQDKRISKLEALINKLID